MSVFLRRALSAKVGSSSAPAAAVRPSRSRTRGFWRGLAAGVGLTALAASIVVAVVVRTWRPEIPRAAATAGHAVPRGATTIETGPWGRVEISDIRLEPPKSPAWTFLKPDQRPVWRMPGFDVVAAQGLFSKAGLEPRLAAALLSAGSCHVAPGGITIFPSLDQLALLPSAARQTIYQTLARLPGNPYHQFPLVIAGEMEPWLAGTGLSALQRAALARLAWRQGELWLFSDASALIQLATSAEEIAEVVQLYGRTPAVRMHVSFDSGTDAAGFFDYWSARQRNHEMLPLLTTLAASNRRQTVDAMLVLPSLCRDRLYTYASINDTIGGRLPDCIWTTLNFFEDQPQIYYVDARSALLEFTKNYEPIDTLAELGDVACFVDRAGNLEHACVYIAAGVVFTKNGAGPAPWVLQRFSITSALFGERLGNTVKFLRPREAATHH